MSGPGHDAGGATAPPDGQVDAQDDSQDNIQTNAQDAPQAGGQTAQITPDLSAILGQAAWVMMQSRAHRHLFVGDMEWLLVPPIAHRQFRLWRRNNMPVAYASWAMLSDEVEARLLESLGIEGDITVDSQTNGAAPSTAADAPPHPTPPSTCPACAWPPASGKAATTSGSSTSSAPSAARRKRCSSCGSRRSRTGR